MGGVALMLADAYVFYRIHLQPTIAQSSTEAEFTNMTDAGKAALYLWWILDELNIIQNIPTPILTDNHSAIKMANAQRPTANAPYPTRWNETLRHPPMDWGWILNF